MKEYLEFEESFDIVEVVICYAMIYSFHQAHKQNNEKLKESVKLNLLKIEDNYYTLNKK